jgi:hypothetical protein
VLQGSNQASGSTADLSFKAEAEADDEWGFVMSSEVQPAGLVEDDYSRPNNLQKGVETEDLSATTHSPEYDLSFFDTLGVCYSSTLPSIECFFTVNSCPLNVNLDCHHNRSN